MNDNKLLFRLDEKIYNYDRFQRDPQGGFLIPILKNIFGFGLNNNDNNGGSLYDDNNNGGWLSTVIGLAPLLLEGVKTIGSLFKGNGIDISPLNNKKFKYDLDVIDGSGNKIKSEQIELSPFEKSLLDDQDLMVKALNHANQSGSGLNNLSAGLNNNSYGLSNGLNNNISDGLNNTSYGLSNNSYGLNNSSGIFDNKIFKQKLSSNNNDIVNHYNKLRAGFNNNNTKATIQDIKLLQNTSGAGYNGFKNFNLQ
jgi:hypothetical protein